MDKKKIYDCIIIGGGPAGLTAAIYLARFRHEVVLIDDNQSRAKLIRLSHNYPGARHGISGAELLLNLKHQLAQYKVKRVTDKICKIKKAKGSTYIACSKRAAFRARYVILATGVEDIEPQLPDIKCAIRNGLIRHCVICDGFEVMNQHIAVLGFGSKGLRVASMLRNYSTHVTLFNLDRQTRFNAQEKQLLKSTNIALVSQRILKVTVVKDIITGLTTEDGTLFPFDTIYSALGVNVRAQFALRLGIKYNNEGYLYVNKHQETNVPGVYAIGDIVDGLSQICVAEGQAAIAACHINHRILRTKK